MLALGPQAVIDLLQDGHGTHSGWQATRAGRPDVPDLTHNQTGGADANRGIVTHANRPIPDVNHSVHDLIHAYHPEADPGTRQDQGYREEQVVESVQVDLVAKDRNVADGTRSSARERMVGYDDETVLSILSKDPPYPGILGEFVYVLEGVRRGVSIYDTVSYEPLSWELNGPNADVSMQVDLEVIARQTRV